MPNRENPVPFSTEDGHDFSAPRRPNMSLKKLGLNNWKRTKQFIRPFNYTVEELETGLVHPNSFRVPRTGAGMVGNSRAATVKVDESADFEWVKLTCVAYDADGNAQNHFGISFRESGSDRRLDNYPLHMLTITGTGQMPFILPATLLIKRAAILSVTFTLYTAATTYIYITLAGVKYYISELQSITTRPTEDWDDERL